jgi:hypothetical protein
MESTNERKWFTLKVGLGALAIKRLSALFDEADSLFRIEQHAWKLIL